MSVVDVSVVEVTVEAECRTTVDHPMSELYSFAVTLPPYQVVGPRN